MNRRHLIRSFAAAALTVAVGALAPLAIASASPNDVPPAPAAPSALPTPPAPPGQPAARAFFVETDQVANKAISYTRSSDGSIACFGTFPTGGTGEAATGSVADPLPTRVVCSSSASGVSSSRSIREAARSQSSLSTGRTSVSSSRSRAVAASPYR